MACIHALASISETWDDLADGDELNRADAIDAFRALLFGLERNPFWARWRPLLQFHVEQMTLLWETSSELERSADWKIRCRAFFLRESANLLVPAVVSILHGHERALQCSLALWEFLPHEEPDQWEFRHEPRRR